MNAGIAVWFVNQEVLLYYSDIRFYHQLALQSWQQWQAGWQAWLAFMQHWLGQDYNAFFTVPLLPGIAWGGDARTLYVALLSLCYLSPAVLIAGWVAARLHDQRPFWLATVLMLSSVALWQPVLRGYPDVGGVLLISLALVLVLRDSLLHHWYTVLGLGILTGLVILFRRHFAYAVVALYAAIALSQTWLLWQQAVNYPRSLIGFGWRLGVTLILSLLLMLSVAPEFTQRALLTNYGLLYDSFQQTPQETLLFLGQGFGVVLPVFSLAGWALVWRSGRVSREKIILCLLLVLIWTLLFIFIVRQPGHHYRIHWLPLFFGLGLTFLALEARRWIAMVTTSLVLLITAYSIIGYNLLSERHEVPSYWWPEPIAAWRYHAEDYDTLLQLADFLRTQSQNNELLYVAASSKLFNAEILLAAEEQIAEQPRLQFLPIAAVDSRDFYPLVTLIPADWVIIPQPALLTVPEQQKVLQLTIDVFQQSWVFSQDFQRLNTDFVLSDGTRLHIYRRIRPTPLPVFIQTLHRMQKKLQGLELGTQADWISASWRGVSIVGDKIRLSQQSEQSPAIATSYPLAVGQWRLRIEQLLLQQCATAYLQAQLYDIQGQPLSKSAQILSQQQPLFEWRTSEHAYLVISLHHALPGCTAVLKRLRVQSIAE